MNEDKVDEARTKLIALIQKVYGQLVQEGVVTDVNANDMDITVETDDGDTLFDVRLRALSASADQSIEVLPAKNSRVLVLKIEDDDYFVLHADKIDSYVVRVGDTVIKITSEGIVFNNGGLGGMVKAKILASELNKNNQLLMAILTVLNGAPVPEAGNGTASALQAALKAAISGKSLGDFSALENEKIKH